MTSPTHLAVLDDDADITLLLANYLQMHGFRVSQLHAGRALMELMGRDAPALILLDLGLPGEDGFEIARTLRAHWHCGLIIVTGRGDAVDKVVGLEVGADDYVTKPFELRELLARVKAVLRRLAPPAPLSALPGLPGMSTVPGATDAPGARATPATTATDRTRLRFDGWQLDTAARRLLDPSGHEVALTGGEFDLLAVLAECPGRVLSRDFLLERTRGRDGGPFDRTIDVQIGRLRRKLETGADAPALIRSVRGAGYLFAPRVEAVE